MHPNLESAAFIVSPTQVALDTAMLSYDIWGTRAHVLMLRGDRHHPAAAGRCHLRGAGRAWSGACRQASSRLTRRAGRNSAWSAR